MLRIDGSESLDGQAQDESIFLSDEEDMEDLTFLFSDDEDREICGKGKGKSRKADDDLIML